MTTQLSEEVKELIHKARIVSFAGWQDSHPAEAIDRFQAADDQGRYLTDEDVQQIQALSPDMSTLMPIAQLLRDQASEIVREAREQVLTTYPEIDKPGAGYILRSGLKPAGAISGIFLRCITYGIAGEQSQYTSTEGLHYMQLLYQELKVPLDAMVSGLEGIKAASLKRVEPNQKTMLAPYFDHLITQLGYFKETAEN